MVQRKDMLKYLTNIINAVDRGEEVLCVACKKGHYRPFNPAFKINHDFVYANCGNSVHWDHVIEIT